MNKKAIVDIVTREISSLVRSKNVAGVGNESELSGMKKLRESLLVNIEGRYLMRWVISTLKTFLISTFALSEEDALSLVKRMRLEIFPIYYAERMSVIKNLMRSRYKEDKITTGCLKTVDLNFYATCAKFFGKESGGFDLESLSTAFEITFYEPPKKTLTEVMKVVVRILEEKKPTVFSPEWLRKNASEEYSFLLYNILGKDSEVWASFYKLLPRKWQCLWKKGTKKRRTFKSVIKEFVGILEKENPDYFGPRYLELKTPNACYYVTSNYRDKEDRPNWDLVISYFPEKWKSRWRIKKSVERTFATALKELRLLLEKENPDYFNRSYLFLKKRPLYAYFLRNFSAIYNQGADFDLVIRHLPIKWQYRWSQERKSVITQSKEYIFESALDRLNSILEAEDPKYFSPRFIKNKDKKLYHFFFTWVRNEDGYVDWKLIVSCVTKRFRSKFKYPRNVNYFLPENFYNNLEQLESLVKRKDLKLWALFAPSDKMNRELANDACIGLIKLAQGGNIEASDMLMEYLGQVVAFWIQNSDSFRVLEYLKDSVDSVIRKSIYMFNIRSKSFLGYLYTQLYYTARNYEKTKKEDISLDSRRYSDGNSLNHEFYSKENIVSNR